MNFWHKLKNKPFFCLAPMADVTDAPFRAMFAKYGKPDVLWTEFVSADGLCSRGKEKLMPMLRYSEKERPIVAQIFSANPENIEKACAFIAKLGFDGIDINMGCPDKSVLKQGAGAALIKTPKLARSIIRSALAGVKSTGKDIPVSVKTRIGFSKIEIEDWIGELIKEDISALTIHARTKKEMSDVPAHWVDVKKVVDLIKNSPDERIRKILVIGNGDVEDTDDGRRKCEETGCDGIMIGRGAFGKPWLFNPDQKEITVAEKLKIMLEHAKLFEKTLTGSKNFAVMKKHFKAYVSGWEGAKELRVKLMEANNYAEIESITLDYLKTLEK
jgi:nifR3 family TIM-barrel protein